MPGWFNFERRWESEDHDTPKRAYREPAWSGEKLSSGNLLLWGEQGIGDEIMFAGLVPDVTRTGSLASWIATLASNLSSRARFPEQCGLRLRSREPSRAGNFFTTATGSLPGIIPNNCCSVCCDHIALPHCRCDARKRLRARYDDGRQL